MSVSSITFAAPTARIRSATNPAIAIARSGSRSKASPEPLSVTELRQQHQTIAKFRNLLPEISQQIQASVLAATSGANVKQMSVDALAQESTFAASATLESTHQINTQSTTFSPSNPNFSGASSAEPIVGGLYKGATNDVFTFTATHSGFVGGNAPLDFEVRNQNGKIVDHANFSSQTRAGTAASLNSGLTLALSGGYVSAGDSFEVAVQPASHESVNPANPFNGVGTRSANIPPPRSVSDGSFTVNGAEIDVLASDSINTVLGKINAANIGVTATFDIARERVVLTADRYAVDGHIALANDTSGFLNAMRLAGAAMAPGLTGGIEKRLSTPSAAANSSSAVSLANAAAPRVDVSGASPNLFSGSVNSADVEVLEYGQAGTSALRRQTDTGRESEDSHDSASSWFTVIGIGTGAQSLTQPGDVSNRHQQQTIRSMTTFTNAVNDTAQHLAGGSGDIEFQAAVRHAFHVTPASGPGTGDAVIHDDPRRLGFEFAGKNETLGLNQTRLESRLHSSPRSAHDLLVGAADDSEGGVIGRLDSALDNLQKRLKYQAVAMGGYIA
ncbi:hypothetical protein Fuma_00829 [Fuerstiella marisgermanici]|uniref:Uncharacterized protein n=2 Tax=Fuerstiella marisgermanici TaxID=1891926 RepID=A0A1P8WB35_9PLAN|nr:hypothetical protein Fuma_00829 [Fuerstiella marisgermanici]